MEKQKLEIKTVEEQMKAMDYRGMFIVYNEYTDYPMAIKKIGEDQYSKVPFNWEEDYNGVFHWHSGEIISYVEVYNILLESSKKNSYHKVLADYYLAKKKVEEKKTEHEIIQELETALAKKIADTKEKYNE